MKTQKEQFINLCHIVTNVEHDVALLQFAERYFPNTFEVLAEIYNKGEKTINETLNEKMTLFKFYKHDIDRLTTLKEYLHYIRTKYNDLAVFYLYAHYIERYCKLIDKNVESSILDPKYNSFLIPKFLKIVQ